MIGGGVVAVAVVAIVLGITLGRGSGGGGASPPTDLPAVGSATWSGALPGATTVRNLYRGIPQTGLVLGAPNAPATLTEFIDLQCPLCQQFETQQMPTIVQRYVRTGKLNIRMEPWSILSPPDSPRGQAATIAASFQNKAFQFAQMLYLNQGQENSGWLTVDMVGRSAASVDTLRPHQVVNGIGASSVKTIVNEVDNTASAKGLTGTPTILLNHRGQKAQIVSVGVPDAAKLLSQIRTAIAG